MKELLKWISVIMAICIVFGSTYKINAAAANTVYSEMWVNAGASAYTSQTSSTTSDRYTCYMRLRWFQFSYYPSLVMPSGYYIYSRLYTISGYKATYLASFSQNTAVGNYNYSYYSGYGSAGQMYKLKTNSSYDLCGYSVIFDWSANPYE
ncbi:MAG: hypothetical protein J5767_13185 [Paludibacteraceae bacterium]|nr:hypothetical protein [Paludibacteraceae bacterium]